MEKSVYICFKQKLLALTMSSDLINGAVDTKKSYELCHEKTCICESKGADQLCSNRASDQLQLRGHYAAVHHRCFRYIDSTSPLLPKTEISSL